MMPPLSSLSARKFLMFRYLHIFWREFYESEYSEATDGVPNEGEDEEEQSETSRWSAVSKKLTWKNQYDSFGYTGRQGACGEKVKQKASAWFRITYEPWTRYVRQMDRDNNAHIRKYPEFFSFAWLVYPVLLDIYQEKHPDSEDEFRVTKKVGRKHRKQRRRHKGKNNTNAATTTQNTNKKN